MAPLPGPGGRRLRDFFTSLVEAFVREASKGTHALEGIPMSDVLERTVGAFTNRFFAEDAASDLWVSYRGMDLLLALAPETEAWNARFIRMQVQEAWAEATAGARAAASGGALVSQFSRLAFCTALQVLPVRDPIRGHWVAGSESGRADVTHLFELHLTRLRPTPTGGALWTPESGTGPAVPVMFLMLPHRPVQKFQRAGSSPAWTFAVRCGIMRCN